MAFSYLCLQPDIRVSLRLMLMDSELLRRGFHEELRANRSPLSGGTYRVTRGDH